MGRRLVTRIAVLTFVALLAGCGDSAGTPTSGSPTPSNDEPSASTGPTSPADSASEPVTNLLAWRPAPSGIDPEADSVEGREWSLAAEDPHTAVLSGAGATGLLELGKSRRISDLLLDEEHAVIVQQDPHAERPGVATVITLRSNDSFSVGPASDPPTTNGGTWALGEGKLLHATYGPKNAYCLAAVDLATRDSSVAWCAPKRQGFNDARITPAGLTVLSFTLGKDGCRTPVSISDGEATPLAGVSECIGWDSLLTPAGHVWSETPDANRIEEASFFVRAGEQAVELGTGDTGSLTWCGDAAYFTQQPQRDGDPARLLRWSAEAQLEIVYETPGSPGFISEPRCGGARITITAKSESGDEQVSAPVS